MRIQKFMFVFLLLAASAFAVNAKISQLSWGKPAQPTDQFIINRANVNVRVHAEDIVGEHNAKALTAAAATAVMRVSVAQGAASGGRFHYCVTASDANDIQIRCSHLRFAVTNDAGTEVCAVFKPTDNTADASIDQTEDHNAFSITSGTLTYAITCSTASANTVDIFINAVSSLTETTLRGDVRIDLFGPGTVGSM